MVTKTEDHNEEATHDVNGTDLRRVREMVARGYPQSMVAECLGITSEQARYAIVVVTGDREGAPPPVEIEQLCQSIQTGWTDEMAVAARHGDRRASSRVAVPTNLTSHELSAVNVAGKAARVAARVAAGNVNVKYLGEKPNGMNWWSRPNYRNRRSSRVFRTHEEALQWGREWMQRQAALDAEAARQSGNQEKNDAERYDAAGGRRSSGCYRGDARRVRHAQAAAEGCGERDGLVGSSRSACA
jgi:hypothetical protein